MWYWQDIHQQAVVTYVLCVTACTSAQTRQHLFNTVLYEPLTQIAKKVLYTTNTKLLNEDNIQELLIQSYTKVLPNLKREKLQGALEYITSSFTNTAINIARWGELNKVSKHNELSENIYDESSTTADILDYRIEINQELDKRIKKMKYINRTFVVFLTYMQRYIQDNNYDVRGFREYVCDKMNISNSEYSALLTKCKITGTEFRQPIESKEKKLVNDNYSKN